MAREVLPEEAEALRREGATLVDVRRAEELAEQQIPGAVHVPLDELGARAGGRAAWAEKGLPTQKG